MQLEIITPEHKIFEGEADAIQLPGKEGMFQILDNHAPIISTLIKGVVKIDIPGSHKHLNELSGHIERDKTDDKVLRLDIKGGVVEVQKNKVILLAD
jgi:F-type H+-transporting ATPase subunit epsilon